MATFSVSFHCSCATITPTERRFRDTNYRIQFTSTNKSSTCPVWLPDSSIYCFVNSCLNCTKQK